MPEANSRRSPGRPSNKTPEETAVETVQEVPDDVVDADETSEIERLKAELAELKSLVLTNSAKTSNEGPADTSEIQEDTNKILIHFVRDGLTVLGKMKYRGQELELHRNGQAYKDTCDRNGWSFLELADDAVAQEERWGYEYFRSGPWTGKSFADIKFEALKQLAGKGGGEDNISAAELAELESFDKKRRRVAEPLPPVASGSPVGRRTGY